MQQKKSCGCTVDGNFTFLCEGHGGAFNTARPATIPLDVDPRNQIIRDLDLQNGRYRDALEKISRLEPGVTTGGTAAWLATDALTERPVSELRMCTRCGAPVNGTAHVYGCGGLTVKAKQEGGA